MVFRWNLNKSNEPWLYEVTIVGVKIWRERDILATGQLPARTPCILSFLCVCQHFQTWLPAGSTEEQTVRLSLRDARLLYIMFLACLGFFHSSLSYSKQSQAVQVLLMEAGLNKPVAMTHPHNPSPCGTSWEEGEDERLLTQTTLFIWKTQIQKSQRVQDYANIFRFRNKLESVHNIWVIQNKPKHLWPLTFIIISAATTTNNLLHWGQITMSSFSSAVGQNTWH